MNRRRRLLFAWLMLEAYAATFDLLLHWPSVRRHAQVAWQRFLYEQVSGYGRGEHDHLYDARGRLRSLT